jgi:hypothetical protein
VVHVIINDSLIFVIATAFAAFQQLATNATWLAEGA